MFNSFESSGNIRICPSQMMKTYFLVVVTCCLAGGAFAKTICEKHREKELLSDSKIKFVPVCTPEGDYAPLQCFSAHTIEHCMCFTPEGRQIYGPKPSFKTCVCHSHRDRELMLEETGGGGSGYVPTCNEDGTYTKKQCNWTTGVCWCSDSEGNRISEEKKGSITC